MSGSFQEAREGLRAALAKLDAIDHLFGLLDTLAASLRNHGQVPELVYDAETGTASLHVRVGRVPPQVSVTVASDVVARPNDQPMCRMTKRSLGDLSDALQRLDSAGAAGIGAVEPSEVPLEALRVQPPEAEGARPAAGGSPAPLPKVAVPSVLSIEASADAFPDDEPEPEPSAPVTYKTGEWTPEEEKRLLALHDEGHPFEVITLKIGRRGAGVSAKLRALLAKRAIPKASAVAARVTQAPPPPRPAAPPPAAGPVLQARPRHEREAEARYAEVLHLEWPPKRDLDLVERMTRGDGAGGTAEAMGIEKTQVLARWRALFPEVPTIEEQAAMLAVLRARVHSEGE